MKVSNVGHFASTVSCLPSGPCNKHGNGYYKSRNKRIYKCSTNIHFKCHTVSDFNKIDRVMTVKELPFIVIQYSSIYVYLFYIVI